MEWLDWTGCYDDNWNGYIVPAAMGHPAKFSRGLIARIYQHMLAQGWLRKGDCVLDPFGGVTKRTERKSFFRRLHERKPGAVKIDWEEVVFAQRKGTHA